MSKEIAKYCVDCQYLNELSSNWCEAPEHRTLIRINLVTGKKEFNNPAVKCEEARINKQFCGPEGRFFKPTTWRRLFPKYVEMEISK